MLALQPSPAAWPRVPGRLPSLQECLALALLLHLLAVALFGNVTGGTARPGEGVFGRLNIRLTGDGPAREQPAAPLAPEAYSGAVGTARERRWGGVVRERPPRAADREPGAARLGTWRETPSPHAADPLPPPAGVPAPPAPAAVPRAPAVPEPAPALRRLTAPADLPPLRPIEPLAPAAAVAPAPLAPAPAPELAPLPPPLRTLRAPAPPPLAPAARPLERVAPVEAAEAPPAVVAPQALPEPRVPATRSLSAPEAAPLPVEQPLTRIAPVEPVAVPAAAPAPRALQAPAAAPAPEPAPLPRPSFGAPDAGAALGHDVATPPTAPASAPRLNLDLARPRGGELSSQGSRGVLNLLPTPPERKSKLAEDIEKAGKADCRNAYSGAGILAVVPLAADALRKDGCRW